MRLPMFSLGGYILALCMHRNQERIHWLELVNIPYIPSVDSSLSGFTVQSLPDIISINPDPRHHIHRKQGPVDHY